MGLVSSVVPNLVGGVSQQAPQVRSKNASKYELNTHHSLVSGLTKRPPTEWVSQIHANSASGTDAAVHAFQAADGTQFLMSLDADSLGNTRLTGVRVSDGKVYSISLTGDGGYLSGISSDFNSTVRFISVGDTIFILNRSIAPASGPVSEDASTGELEEYDLTAIDFASLPSANDYELGTVARLDNGSYYEVRLKTVPHNFGVSYEHYWGFLNTTAGTSRKDPKLHATVYIRQAVHTTEYSFTIEYEDGTKESATYKTVDATSSTGDPQPINTDVIALSLADNFNVNSTAASAIQIGASLSITASKNIRKVTFKDGFGDQAMRAFGDSVQDFADLPPNEVEGRVVRINGSVDTGGDDYFVEYRDAIWKETVAFGARTRIEPSTMPATVVYSPVNDTFTMTQHSWPGRTSGDNESNPKPTFVGRVINDMFLFKGRMCVLADENVVFSEVGFYENFYRTTLTLLLETDPIDIAATASSTSILHSGVPFDETLVVFSDNQQFRILSGDSLTPQNVEIVPTTTYNSSKNAQPIPVGQNVFFVEDYERSRYGTIMEYYRSPNTDTDDASSVTASVPKYIPNRIKRIRAASNENIVTVLTKNNGGEVYIYRYFWSGGEKVLSSWTKWKISNASEILSMDFFGDSLFFLCRNSSGAIFLLRCDTEEGRFDLGVDFHFHMDFRIDGSLCSPTYDSANDRTSYTLPYVFETGYTPFVIVKEDYGDYPPGVQLDVTSVSGSTIYVSGDTTAFPVFLGFAYDMIYDFSKQFMRRRVGDGEAVDQTARLSLRYMTLFFDDTGFFKIEVRSEGRKVWESNYTARKFQSEKAQTDLLSIGPGSHRFSCKGNAQTTDIRIINSTPFPSAFTSASWEAQYNPKARSV